MRLADDLGFPPFSGGGEYLQVHYLEDILRVLGSPKDDYKNYFTARLLLLLESQPLYNEELYNEVIGDVIDSYFRDFPDHEEEFRPLFLINDIIRFWRTLCLNYEYKRNPERKESEDRASTKDHRKNLKLKYSRLLTCFSAVLALADRDFRVDPCDVLEVTQKVPLERVRNLDVSGEAEDIREGVLRNYTWFLETMSGNKQEQIEWFANEENRATAFGEAQKFGRLVYELLCHVVDNNETMRYLVI
jgi:hypothetical protein